MACFLCVQVMDLETKLTEVQKEVVEGGEEIMCEGREGRRCWERGKDM